MSSQRYVLNEEAVSRYVQAVDDRSGRGQTGLAPPMAVAALSLRGVVNDLQIPGGTLHAGQELEFCADVPVGTPLECRANLLQNSVRGSWRFLVVGLEVESEAGLRVMEGKSTIMVPEEL